ncbi:MAG: hypothetical protein P8I94_00985, partial [Emcibacteraceae bacterium]|nr:hypothetical protein [Emcibacteraceae bacterium]
MVKITDLPSTIEGPASWLGSEIVNRDDDWMIHLEQSDIADLEQAASYFLSLGRDIGEITASDFPLKSFHLHLDQLKNKL